MNKKIEKLIVKYVTKSATASDLDILSKWIEKPDNEKVFKDYVQIHYAINYGMNNPEAKKTIEKLLSKIRKEKTLVYKLNRFNVFKYAAAIIVGILATTYFFKSSTSEDLKVITPKTETPLTIVKNSIEEGMDKAILTLEDGSNIALEKDKTFKTNRVTSNGKKLIYTEEKNNKLEIKYNYLTIPTGGQFYVKLSDGTEVWLNSESQLKYPVSFIKGEPRKVELVYGEAYFDVSPSTNHNGAKFKVINQNQEVEVFGTEFNIKAYKDEGNVYTTLVEGKVVISNSSFKQNLLPNQQSILNLKNKEITINTIDVYSETAWIKGFFSFKSKSLKDIMIVLSRWYDVKVVFENLELEKVKFNGVLSKNDNMEDILETIKNTNFIKAYEIKNKQIIIK
ncbi:FecR family protein [Thalassobellus suaedae]|uniref:FecR family protein n=1 Tax=Thalassobellus suaedae TaxID=3074124 RepID=A0ABY9XZ29_9FLAO|nr:FecR family protein [Flavobacteriaceae bacterium HL-DH10]